LAFEFSLTRGFWLLAVETGALAANRMPGMKTG